MQWDPHEYRPSPEAWATICRRLDFMRPSFIRVMSGAGSYCTGVDAAGEPRYVFGQGEARVQERFGPLFAVPDYAQAHGIEVMLGSSASTGRGTRGDRSELRSDLPARGAVFYELGAADASHASKAYFFCALALE